jgi:LytS/YehU family sensor histidine kinase
MPGSERGGLADVVYALCLMQASFLVLAGVGEVLMMGGNGIYVIASLIKAAALLWLGAGVVRSRRWALITLIVLQALTLAAIPVQIIIGLAPAVEFAPSLVELLTGVVVPMAMIAMCALLFGRRRQHQARNEKERAKAEAATYELALAKNPYAGWGVSR